MAFIKALSDYIWQYWRGPSIMPLKLDGFQWIGWILIPAINILVPNKYENNWNGRNQPYKFILMQRGKFVRSEIISLSFWEEEPNLKCSFERELYILISFLIKNFGVSSLLRLLTNLGTWQVNLMNKIAPKLWWIKHSY